MDSTNIASVYILDYDRSKRVSAMRGLRDAKRLLPGADDSLSNVQEILRDLDGEEPEPIWLGCIATDEDGARERSEAIDAALVGGGIAYAWEDGLPADVQDTLDAGAADSQGAIPCYEASQVAMTMLVLTKGFPGGAHQACGTLARIFAADDEVADVFIQAQRSLADTFPAA
jgi:hypothetical protein